MKIKRLISTITVICFLGLTTLSHATEIARVTFTQDEQQTFVVEEERLSIISENDISAGADDDTMFTAFAVIGILVVVAGLLIAVSDSDTK